MAAFKSCWSRCICSSGAFVVPNQALLSQQMSAQQRETTFEEEVDRREIDGWMREYDLYDETLMERERRKRFAHFCKLTFELAPKKDWKKYLVQLLPFEQSMAGS